MQSTSGEMLSCLGALDDAAQELYNKAWDRIKATSEK